MRAEQLSDSAREELSNLVCAYFDKKPKEYRENVWSKVTCFRSKNDGSAQNMESDIDSTLWLLSIVQVTHFIASPSDEIA